MVQLPEIKPIGEYVFPKLGRASLSNNIPLFYIPFGATDIVRVDVVVEAGVFHQNHFFVANMTQKLLRCGTLHHTSREISEQLDYYGGSLVAHVAKKFTIFSLLSLKKHLSVLLDLLKEIITEPSFPENEFELMRLKDKQAFLTNEKVVSTMASRGLNRCIYGENGTYGKTPKASDYDNLQLSWIKEFYTTYYKRNRCRIFLSGAVSDDVRCLVDEVFATMGLPENEVPVANYVCQPMKERCLFIPKENVVQSAVYVGSRLFDRTHPDIYKVCVLNTILGGYFGSRLMSNIREEKGYTYGIHSSISIQDTDTLLIVTTQADNRYVRPLLGELYKEMRRLQEEPVPDDELEIVKNYMLGEILRSSDGSFSIVDAYINMQLIGQEMDEYFHQKTLTIQSVTPEDLLLTARAYLNKDAFYEVVAGCYE